MCHHGELAQGLQLARAKECAAMIGLEKIPGADETGSKNKLIISLTSLHIALLRLLGFKVVVHISMSQGWIRATKTRVFLRLRHDQPQRYAVTAKAEELNKTESHRAALILIMALCQPRNAVSLGLLFVWFWSGSSSGGGRSPWVAY